MTYPQDKIEEMITNNEIPTRLAVLDLEGNLVGYKGDSCWTLSTDPEKYKVHSFKDTRLEGQLAKNLLFCFNSYQKETGLKESWVGKYLEGVIVSVQEVSKQNFGKELLRYRIQKQEDKYLARE